MEIGSIVGKFRVEVFLGRGGGGDVWRAWDTELKRFVALKFLKGSDEEELARFRREAQTAAQLNHPNIAAVYEAHERYIAMQLIEGQTLQAHPRTDVRSLAEIVRQAAVAVQAAHERGVIHRDLKPANLMVTGRAEAPHVYVMDFGLAKSTEIGSEISMSGVVMGTPAYMPPEQARGRSKEVGPRSDVYALGATLYELLADRAPFAGPNAFEILRKVVEEEPRSPRHYGPRADADLETIVLKCLEKDPARRYGTARELAEELSRWLEGEPILARPVSGVERMARRVRRHKALAATAVAFVVVVAGAGVLLAVQKAASSRKLADEQVQRKRREGWLQKVATLWSSILEKKRELRQLRVPVAEARRELASAVSAMDEAVAAFPEEPHGYYVRGRGRLYLGQLEGAEADARLSVSKRDDFRPGWSLLGMTVVERYLRTILGSSERYDERLLSARPMLREMEEAFARGWPEKREEAESAVWGIASTREDQVLERLSRAFQLAFAKEQVTDARRILEEAAGDYNAEEYAHWIGNWSRSYREAGVWLDKAVLWAEGYAPAYLDRAKVRSAFGETKLAIADATMYLKLEGEVAEAYLARSNFREAARDFQGAIDDASAAIRLKPGLEAAWRARASAKRASGDAAGAIADLDRAIDCWPAYAEAHLERGALRWRAGEKAGARADLDRAIEIRPSYAAAYNDRGAMRKLSDDPAGAEADYTKAIELDGKLAAARRNRANLRMATGNGRGALEDWNAAIDLEPASAANHTNRAVTKESLGDLRGAVADYEQALKIAPRNWEHREAVAKRLAEARARLGN